MNEIRQLCECSDIVCLQETWLCSLDSHILSRIDESFHSSSITSMSLTDNIVRGRPHGGLSILWKKNFRGCKVVDFNDERIMALEITTNAGPFLIVNVYLPCDHSDSTDDFLFYLAKISSIIEDHKSSYVCVVGDFNANTIHGKKSRFGEELKSYCRAEGLHIADLELCEPSPFTFYCAAHDSVSWLDHVLMPEMVFSRTCSIEILKDFITSDHLPILANLNIMCSEIYQSTFDSNDCHTNIYWQDLTSEEIDRYRCNTECQLKSVAINHSLLLCDDPGCTDVTHRGAMDRMILAVQMLHTEGQSTGHRSC